MDRSTKISKKALTDKRFAKIRALKCYQEMYENLCANWPIKELARWIQEEKREYTEISRSSLTTILTEFRKAAPALDLVKNESLPLVEKALDRVENGLNTLEELEKLYQIQVKRILMDHKIENALGKSMATTGNEIRIAKELLISYEETRMDLGLSKRHLGQIDVDTRVVADVIASYQSPEIGKILEDPMSRAKLLNATDKVMKLLASGGLPEGFLDDEEEDETDYIEVTEVKKKDDQGE